MRNISRETKGETHVVIVKIIVVLIISDFDWCCSLSDSTNRSFPSTARSAACSPAVSQSVILQDLTQKHVDYVDSTCFLSPIILFYFLYLHFRFRYYVKYSDNIHRKCSFKIIHKDNIVCPCPIPSATYRRIILILKIQALLLPVCS